MLLSSTALTIYIWMALSRTALLGILAHASAASSAVQLVQTTRTGRLIWGLWDMQGIAFPDEGF